MRPSTICADDRAPSDRHVRSTSDSGTCTKRAVGLRTWVIAGAILTMTAAAILGGRAFVNNRAKASDLVAADLAYLTNASIPLAERMQAVRALTQRNDAPALTALMRLGDEKAYLNATAVEAVGAAKDQKLRPTAERYLRLKLAQSGARNTDDMKVTCAAVRAWIRLMGASGVSELAQCLERNQTRVDGYEDIVCGEVVEALSLTASAEAVPAIAAELARVADRRSDLDYELRVVRALKRFDDDAARSSLDSYARRMKAAMPSELASRTQHHEQEIADANRVDDQSVEKAKP
jgi:hypothetical protein